MPRGKRIKLATGIYRDNLGYAIVATVHGRRIEQRWPGDLTLQALKTKREQLIHKLSLKVPRKGTLKADVEVYLASLPDGSMKRNRVRECGAWGAFYGKPRSVLTSALLKAEMQTWTMSASSSNKAITALKAVYHFHDGPEAPTPLDHIPRAKQPREIRRVPQAVVTMILRAMGPSKSRARLKVLARTGLPQKQISKIQPHHLDLDAREVTVTPRRKGHGVPARTLPLTHKAVRAFKEFQRMQAFGAFSNHSLWDTFQVAVEKAKARWKGRWPAADHIRPYDLRHAFLTEVYRESRDLRATSELALHSDLSTTARYAEAAVTDTAVAARDALEAMPRNRRVARHLITPFRAKKQGTRSGSERGTPKRNAAKTAGKRRR